MVKTSPRVWAEIPELLVYNIAESRTRRDSWMFDARASKARGSSAYGRWVATARDYNRSVIRYRRMLREARS